MESNWDFYFSRVNDALSSIYVDQVLHRAAPMSDKPWLIFVCVYFNVPRDDGLSSNEEAPILFEIEDALESVVRSAVDGIPVGRITGSKRREFYFYAARSFDVDASIASAMSRFPDYRFEVGCEEDTKWDQYLNLLYPSPRDQQRMSNRHVLEQLEEQGDQHALERPVDHFMYFTSIVGRNACKSALSARGYRIEAEETSGEPNEEMPYSLAFTRVDKVEWDRINEVTLELCELAIEHDGTYDGWGCEVTTSD